MPIEPERLVEAPAVRREAPLTLVQRRYRLPACLGSLLLFVGAILVLSGTALAGMAEVGQVGPRLRLLDLDGRTVVLEDESPDRAVLVMFSSVGCVPCRESEPLLVAAGEELGERLSVAVVMLAEPDVVQGMLRAEGQETGLRFLSDSAGEELFPVAGAYGVLATPTTFLRGRDGQVLWRHVGRLTPEHLEHDLPEALALDAGRGGVVSRR